LLAGVTATNSGSRKKKIFPVFSIFSPALMPSLLSNLALLLCLAATVVSVDTPASAGLYEREVQWSFLSWWDTDRTWRVIVSEVTFS
jgi:hypothetical protein